MPQYLSETRGWINVEDMARPHILNAILKLEREGYVSNKHHKEAIMANRNACRYKTPHRQLDALYDELNRRDQILGIPSEIVSTPPEWRE